MKTLLMIATAAGLMAQAVFPPAAGGGGSSVTAGFGLSKVGSEISADAAVVATQTADNTFVGRQDATGASSTAPIKAGTSLPASCVVGDIYVKTNATATNMLYACTATNTWTAQGGAGTKPNDIYRTIAVGCANGGSGSIAVMWWYPTSSATYSCDNSGEGSADFQVNFFAIIPYQLPDDWDGNSITLKLTLRHLFTESISFTLATSCQAAGGDWTSPSYNTGQTISISPTANQTTYVTKTGVTMTGCTAGNVMYLKLTRDNVGSGTTKILSALITAGRS